MVAVFVKLNIDRNKKMAKSTRSVRNAIKKRSEEKKRRGLHIDLDKLPTKQYGKGRDSDQPRKPMEPESAAEKKALDKMYKRKQDFYAPVKLPFSPEYKKMTLDEEKKAEENKKKAEKRKKLQRDLRRQK